MPRKARLLLSRRYKDYVSRRLYRLLYFPSFIRFCKQSLHSFAELQSSTLLYFCSYDQVYQKQDLCFLLYFKALGQIVT